VGLFQTGGFHIHTQKVLMKKITGDVPLPMSVPDWPWWSWWVRDSPQKKEFKWLNNPGIYHIVRSHIVWSQHHPKLWIRTLPPQCNSGVSRSPSCVPFITEISSISDLSHPDHSESPNTERLLWSQGPQEVLRRGWAGAFSILATSFLSNSLPSDFGSSVCCF
jgi:hypothetical protein